MNPREDRQKVMVKARMRSGVSWNDICILNLSLHGLGIQAADPPSRGTYVEVCRGTQTIVARVVWATGRRAGLRSQDTIFIEALTNDNAMAEPRHTKQQVERRWTPRSFGQSHDRSRLTGRAMEFACLLIFAGALAMAAVGAVEQALAAPLSRIKNVL